MPLIYSEYNNYKSKLEKLYLKSFSEKERFPFFILEESSKDDSSLLYAILDKDKLIGMCYLVNCDVAFYLMYLAVEPRLRNEGYGSKILKDLKNKYGTIFLSIEEPIDDLDIKRKKFYLKNGFYDTNKCYEDTGVNYEVLCTNPEFKITSKNMLKRYTNMTKNKNLFKVISNIFNTHNVNLKNK